MALTKEDAEQCLDALEVKRQVLQVQAGAPYTQPEQRVKLLAEVSKLSALEFKLCREYNL